MNNIIPEQNNNHEFQNLLAACKELYLFSSFNAQKPRLRTDLPLYISQIDVNNFTQANQFSMWEEKVKSLFKIRLTVKVFKLVCPDQTYNWFQMVIKTDSLFQMCCSRKFPYSTPKKGFLAWTFHVSGNSSDLPRDRWVWIIFPLRY